MKNYRNILALAALAVSAATLASCTQNNQTASTGANNAVAHTASDGHNHAEGESHDAHGGAAHTDMAHGSTVHNHSTDLKFSSAPSVIEVGKPAKMTLQIVGKTDGKPVSDFEVVHDKKLHFIVVSDDLNFFNHIHPQFVGDGKFEIETTLPNSGGYRLYADYKPTGKDGEVALQEIEVGGTQLLSSTLLTPDTMRGGWMVKNVASHVEGEKPAKNATRYQVALMPMPSKIEAGKDIMLHFQVRDAASKPVAKLEPYLGARGHSVILSPDDPKVYLHTHPMDGSHDMGAMKDGATKMSEESKKADKKTAGSDVMFHTNFPKAGLYKIWGQFKHNGKIISAPFVVNVGAAKVGAAKASAVQKTSTASESVAIPANAQKITVSLPDGYKDGAATVKAGRPVALTFKLTSNAGCGNEIEVPAAKWSKTLKVGESATVVYTPTKSGTLKYACSMNMYAGSLTVQ